MKKLTLLLLPMLLFACNSVEKHRASIEQVATLWNEATQAVTGFSENVNNTLSQANNRVSAIQIDAATLQAADEEVQTQWNTAQTGYASAMQAFGPIQTGLGELMATWGDKTSILTGLTEGLAAGKLDGDVASKVTELTTAANNAKEKLAEWQPAFDQAKSQLMAAVQQMSTLHASIAGESAE